jgi:hypothetical protein
MIQSPLIRSENRFHSPQSFALNAKGPEARERPPENSEPSKVLEFSVVDGRWSMVDGRWSLVGGRWSMAWLMVDGR